MSFSLSILLNIVVQVRESQPFTKFAFSDRRYFSHESYLVVRQVILYCNYILLPNHFEKLGRLRHPSEKNCLVDNPSEIIKDFSNKGVLVHYQIL